MKNTRLLMLVYMLMILALATLWGCSAEIVDEPVVPDRNQQTESSVNFVGSRADDVEHNTPFMAWCDMTYYNIEKRRNVRTPVFERYKVDYNDENWYYNSLTVGGLTQSLHYWNQEAIRYNFDAVSPFTESANVNYTDYTISITGVTGNRDTAVDWLVASHCRYINEPSLGLCDEDLFVYQRTSTHNYITDIEDYYSIVNLCFHHILSMVDFRFYKKDMPDVALEINDLKITILDNAPIATRADYSSMHPRWSNHTSYTDVIAALTSIVKPVGIVDVTSAEVDYKDIALSAYTSLEIPQDVKDRRFKLELTTSDGQTYSGEFTFNRNWNEETRNVYYFEIPPDDTEIILVGVSVDPFLSTEDVNVEDPVVNW